MTTTEIPTASPVFRLVDHVDGTGHGCEYCAPDSGPVEADCDVYVDDGSVSCCGACVPAVLREHADSWQDIVVETTDTQLVGGTA